MFVVGPLRLLFCYGIFSAADLGMFSMFGRTGAPTKRGPTKGAANFLHAGNTEIMGDSPEVNEREEQKKVASFSGELTPNTRTVMTRKGRQFFSRKNR